METSQSVIQVAICDDEKIICTELEVFIAHSSM